MVERIRAAGEDPAEYVEISFKVPERAYVAWPEAIRQGFEPARTVKTGTLKIDLLPQEDWIYTDGWLAGVLAEGESDA
ncbi:hypothetical protein [Paracoccus sp. S3-43]|uniref:hypothetical protein n=1 Tax=Paracoccus sp. S3-43 TaxID=3030011 RepID=UPI0023AEFA1B|nr:hypothetical protein [Paracoccus sp. S3-43]WEF24715.1 hypothetical protein PXD02_01775 [Paracoccus sp. S3-43]